MKQLPVLALFVFMIFGCNSEHPTSEVKKKDYLSTWLLNNEDSLYHQFMTYVSANSLCKGCDTNWASKGYLLSDEVTYMGSFTRQVQQFCDSINVNYFYDRLTRQVSIQLWPQCAKSCVPVLDSILSSVDSLKYFKIQKYLPRSDADIFGLRNGRIDVKEIRLHMINAKPPFALVVFLKTDNLKLLDEAKRSLPEKLFGEEFILKKIKSISFEPYEEYSESLISLRDFINMQNIR